MKTALPRSLYIHIPFCESICSYCDFCKYLCNEELEKNYIKALKKELSQIPNKELDTIYIGGGTPSALSDDLFYDLLSFIHSNFTCKEEFTMEANPESLSLTKAKMMKEFEVNRVSLGVQSFKDEILLYLNRKHDESKVKEVVGYLQKVGITNYSFDFIYGIKDQKEDDLAYDLKKIEELKPKHVSFYSLQVEKGTPLYIRKEPSLNEDKMADYYEYIVSNLEKIGYKRYEVSNFALEGFESKHNKTYWKDDMYYASGIGATSYVDGVREVRTSNIFNYINGKDIIVSSIKESIKDQEFDFIMLNLRLEEGFTFENFSYRFHKDFLKAYSKELSELKDDFIIDRKSIRVKKENMYILDAILVDLLHF